MANTCSEKQRLRQKATRKRQAERHKARALVDLEYRQMTQQRTRDYTRRHLARKKLADPNFQQGRKQHLHRKYGIAIEDYEMLLRVQDNKCGICGRPPAPGEKRLAVDHDHESDFIRGLLCGFCNPGLGLFKHDPHLLQKAIEWLTK